MFDINFYMKFHPLQKELAARKQFDRAYLEDVIEDFRSKTPIVYNIETTNACNMKCQMCPRTTMMTRRVETISKQIFTKVVDQLKPHSETDWNQWKIFVENEYGIKEDDMSENHFFLYIIPKVIQLHGYGDPLLDRNMNEYIMYLNKKGFYSYFSCNPSNIDLQRTFLMLESGLDYIKYSIESVDDDIHKKIRGNASDFRKSYEKILQVINFKNERNLKTNVVITMLDLNRKHQESDYENLKKAFEGLDVYIYLKSEDQQWYRRDFHGTKSIHWSEVCKHPWMSMTVKSNADVVMCMEDYNNEIVLGNAERESLYDIWNGSLYYQFRKDHYDNTNCIKCVNQCDMKLIGAYL